MESNIDKGGDQKMKGIGSQLAEGGDEGMESGSLNKAYNYY